MTNPFNSGDTGSGPAWGTGSGNVSGNTPGEAPDQASPFGSSPFGAPPSGPPAGTPSGNGGGARGIDVSSGFTPANGPVTFSAPGGPGAPGAPAPVTDAPVTLTPVTGPWAFLAAATTAAVVGVLLGIAAPLTGTATESLFQTFSVVGWVLAGIVTFILLGVHTARDTRRQAENFYVGTTSQRTLYRVTAGLACGGVLITAVEIALWISKTVGV